MRQVVLGCGAMIPSCLPLDPLQPAEWRGLAEAHRSRALRYTAAARVRADRGQAHAVEDFLFTYYPFSFAKLETWHPGTGVGLVCVGGPPPAFSARHYTHRDGVLFADRANLRAQDRQRLMWTRDLLVATRDRTPNFSCLGLHEWAMVYQGGDVRHGLTTPLRLPQREIDALVESLPVCCSHYDAFRFFAEPARRYNRLQPSAESRASMEQPACLHANMDLYKWAAKSSPWIASELLLDCFELALDMRGLDMRASPYDVRAYGLSPVAIETAEGRRQYEAEQRELADRAHPLRQRLIDGLEIALAAY